MPREAGRHKLIRQSLSGTISAPRDRATEINGSLLDQSPAFGCFSLLYKSRRCVTEMSPGRHLVAYIEAMASWGDCRVVADRGYFGDRLVTASC